MRCSITCDGVPISFVELRGGPVVAGHLAALPAYEQFGLRRVARRLGLAVTAHDWPRLSRHVVARALDSALREASLLEDRLCLVDERGATVTIRGIVLVELPRKGGAGEPYVVVDLGEQAAGIPATKTTPTHGGGDASRPAA